MQELNTKEVELVSGGNWLAIGGALVAIYDAAAEFIEGFSEQMEKNPPKAPAKKK